MIRLTTNKGVIDLELDYEHAPATSKNFEQYVRDGFYNNTIFHLHDSRRRLRTGHEAKANS